MMYVVDKRDNVVELMDLPQSSVGAPCPFILSSEQILCVAYLLQEPSNDMNDPTVSAVATDSPREQAAIVRFVRPYASMFGPPNDEAFAGHPLAKRGLNPYGCFEVQHSSWIRSLKKMNSVHPYHRSEQFDDYRHFVLAFHDTTFECIATGYTHEVTSRPLNDVAAQEAAALPYQGQK